MSFVIFLSSLLTCNCTRYTKSKTVCVRKRLRDSRGVPLLACALFQRAQITVDFEGATCRSTACTDNYLRTSSTTMTEVAADEVPRKRGLAESPHGVIYRDAFTWNERRWWGEAIRLGHRTYNESLNYPTGDGPTKKKMEKKSPRVLANGCHAAVRRARPGSN